MKKYYITYEKEDPTTVWGIGTTPQGSLKDARNEWGGKKFPDNKMETCRASKNLYDFVSTQWGGLVPWKKRDGKGILITRNTTKQVFGI